MWKRRQTGKTGDEVFVAGGSVLRVPNYNDLEACNEDSVSNFA
jgi:hypothetical protein